MTEFLKTVANHYMERSISLSKETGTPASMPLSDYVFCFPNHRSALFFSRHLQKAFGSTCLVPDTITINELYGLFSHRFVADRTTLLFKLYNIYRQLSQRSDKEEFDQFVFWGDMLIADFEDVDRYLISADKLFANIKDLKEIDAAFAGYDPETVEVIQSFWRNYKPISNSEDAKREAFSQTWSILKDLYILFKKELAAENLAYPGMMEREVAENDEISLTGLPYKKVIFVGLTAITKADRKLMLRLKNQGMAEFCWDYADSLIRDRKSPLSSAAYFTSNNLLDFPNEISEEELKAGLVPDIDRKYSLYAVPSAVGQTQLARLILQQWQQGFSNFDPFRTAVVLTDEKLLIPMLYAVPSELGTFNVTMGYNLKNTPVAAFVQNLANLQEVYRNNESTAGSFYYKQVQPILQNNYVTAISGENARNIFLKISESNLYQVQTTEFQSDDFLSLIFKHVDSADETIDYILEILEKIMQYSDMFTETDYEFLYHYHATVEKLGKSFKKQTFFFTPRTLFQLLNKLINGVSVPFSGEPLYGLQIMGVLETRALDFDNIIFLSMNEGIFPAKPTNNSFVPASLRNAFDMPTQKHRDAVFAYHFYRLISRAKNVALIYDSRTDGLQTGEESRYIKQLRFLLGHEELKPKVLDSYISTTSGAKIEVKKTPEMLELLRRELGPEGKKSISASSFKDYIKCPLRFYLGFVKHLQEDQDVNEGVDQRTFGDILHDALKELYSRSEGKIVDAGLLNKYIEHPDREITSAIINGFKNIMKIDHVDGYNLLVSRILVQYATDVLKHDKKLGPFTYLAGEKKIKFLYKISDGLQIRIVCIFDRLDQLITNNSVLRVVDYKTGNSQNGNKLKMSELEQMFTPEGKGSAEAFQVMLYCLMLMYATPEELAKLHLKENPCHLTPHLYFVRDFNSTDKTETNLVIKSGKNVEIVDDFALYADSFKDHFHNLIADIFDPDKPFVQCEKDHHCKTCSFSSYCQR